MSLFLFEVIFELVGMQVENRMIVVINEASVPSVLSSDKPSHRITGKKDSRANQFADITPPSVGRRRFLICTLQLSIVLQIS